MVLSLQHCMLGISRMLLRLHISFAASAWALQRCRANKAAHADCAAAHTPAPDRLAAIFFEVDAHDLRCIHDLCSAHLLAFDRLAQAAQLQLEGLQVTEAARLAVHPICTR